MAIRRALVPAAIALAFALGSSVRAQSPSNADCAVCHKAASVVVDASVHGKLNCVDCHQDLLKGPLPHAAKLARVDCLRCHSNVVDRTRAHDAQPTAKDDRDETASHFPTGLVLGVFAVVALATTFWFARRKKP